MAIAGTIMYLTINAMENRKIKQEQERKQQAATQALQGKHSHSKQQSKRYKANGPATATCTPVPPQAHTLALCRPKCHVKRR